MESITLEVEVGVRHCIVSVGLLVLVTLLVHSPDVAAGKKITGFAHQILSRWSIFKTTELAQCTL